jgi:cell division protein FtsW (lipid II flippase)
MDERELARGRRERSRKFQGALALIVLGVGSALLGALYARSSVENETTAAGFAVGLGLALAVSGIVVAWKNRSGDTRWMNEAPQTRRDRLQAQRSRQLFLFPAVALVFTGLAVEPVNRIVADGGALRDWLAVLLPLIYAWVTAATAMGWDGHSRQNRRFLEDELTVALRARAVTAAFLVLMIGSTAALALMLAQPRFGATALMFALVAAGGTAGIRFAWLDREAGQDG